MNEIQRKVTMFNVAFGIPVETEPTFKHGLRLGMKPNLVQEEAEELAIAVGNRDMVAIADALGDLLYVTFGMAIELGLDMDRVVSAIHKSNMTKLTLDGKPILREDGKILKSDRYQPPDLGFANVLSHAITQGGN